MTLLGIALLAVSEDREAAPLRGINVRALGLGAFAVSGIVAGLLGPLIGPKTFAVATLGSALALKGFVALAIGGFGSAARRTDRRLRRRSYRVSYGPLPGTSYSNLMIFAVLLLMLLLRPDGPVRQPSRTDGLRPGHVLSACAAVPPGCCRCSAAIIVLVLPQLGPQSPASNARSS